MNKYQFIFVAIVASAFQLSDAHADKLPLNAVKVSASELHDIYAGKSLDWGKDTQYYAPDGKFLMMGNNKTWYAKGTWTVSSNEICAHSEWTDLPSKTTGTTKKDCMSWWKSGSDFFAQDSGETTKKNGYFDARTKLKSGDAVSATVTALEKKKNW